MRQVQRGGCEGEVNGGACTVHGRQLLISVLSTVSKLRCPVGSVVVILPPLQDSSTGFLGRKLAYVLDFRKLGQGLANLLTRGASELILKTPRGNPGFLKKGYGG